MEEAVSVKDIKDYLRIDGEEEDLLLAGILRSAQAHCEDYLKKSLPSDSPAPVKQAVMLLVSHFYAQRTGEPIPNVVYALLAPYRDLSW